MPLNPTRYYAPTDCKRASEALEAVIIFVLFEYAVNDSSAHLQITRGFTSRTAQLLKSIRSLWTSGDFDSCSVLLRCMLERLFTLVHLKDSNEFQVFEDWSFYRQCQYLIKARNEIGGTNSTGQVGFDLTVDQEERFKKLLSNPPVWKRPKPADMAKRMKLEPLYHFCYDSASTLVHPLANDGQRDFYSLTKLEPAPDFPEARNYLHNSLLIALALLENGMTISELRWRLVLREFVDQMMSFLETGKHSYAESFLNLRYMIRDGIMLSEP